MIEALARKITELMIEQESITRDEAEIHQYGAEITLSNLLNITLILLVSIVARNILAGIIFLTIFIFLRKFCGGYHATTYLRCNIVFVLTYTAVLVLSHYVVVPFTLNAIFIMLGLIIIYLFAPVPNSHKTLTIEEGNRNRRWSLIICIILSFIQLLISEMFVYYSMVIFFSLAAIYVMIIVEMIMQKLGLHEKGTAFSDEDE